MHTSSLSGFYFPDVLAEDKYYNGSILEEEYEKKLMVRRSLMDWFNQYPIPSVLKSEKENGKIISSLIKSLNFSALLKVCQNGCRKRCSRHLHLEAICFSRFFLSDIWSLFQRINSRVEWKCLSFFKQYKYFRELTWPCTIWMRHSSVFPVPRAAMSARTALHASWHLTSSWGPSSSSSSASSSAASPSWSSSPTNTATSKLSRLLALSSYESLSSARSSSTARYEVDLIYMLIWIH